MIAAVSHWEKISLSTLLQSRFLVFHHLSSVFAKDSVYVKVANCLAKALKYRAGVYFAFMRIF